MLDSFAKRLNSQLRPSPGDISAGDRWAAGGHFRPTLWREGLLVATLGALAASFVGDAEGATTAHAVQDRYRMELRPYPGTVDVGNRYAYAGHYKYSGTDDDSVGGVIEANLGALTASFRGTVTNIAIDGRIQSSLGALTASLRGDSYFDVFFDIEWSSTPTFTVTDLPPSSGAIAATLGSLEAHFVGVALPPDSTDGRIAATLGALSSSLRGTMTAPAARSGLIHGDLGSLTTSFSGSSVPPDGRVGQIASTLSPLSSSFAGTFVPWSTDGRLSASLGGLETRISGQFIAAGAIVGLLNPQLGALTASFRGVTTSDVTPAGKGKTFKPSRKHRTLVVRKSGRTFKA